MANILVIEDDKEINALVCDYLTTLGHEVLSELNGMSGLSSIRAHADLDLVLLDLMLPYQSGDMVLKKLREFSKLPVIVLSAKDTVQTKIDFIRLGADDYITKPFDLDEVAVRIEAVLRRAGQGAKQQTSAHSVRLTFKQMVLDREAKTVTVNGHKLELTGKEYGILELLLKNQTKLYSKANLFESVWNEPYYAEDNTLKVHMSNIRNKIKKYDEEEYIETIWGMGYKLKN